MRRGEVSPMSNRLQFLLGLFLGIFTAFRLRLPESLPASLDFTEDAFAVCDRAGKVTKTNPAAQALFGFNNSSSLRYFTGQPVPPGQHPLKRAALSCESYSGTYRFISAGGSERIVKVSAKPRPNGGAAAVFRDVTVLHDSDNRAQAASARQKNIQALCRRLGEAQTTSAIGQAITEESYSLFGDFPDVQIRLWMLDPLADTLICVSSYPDERPKRPKSAAETKPLSVCFDVRSPELWQLYVARKPFENSLPLVAGGVAIGHLSVTTKRRDWERETLEIIASLAALALAGSSAEAQAAVWAAQSAAVREITAAMQLGRSRGEGELADLVAAHIKYLVGADVCTLSIPTDGTLCVIGQAFEDDLLSPKTAPSDPRLHGKAVQKAFRTQKLAVQSKIQNPSLEAGPWRAFAGSAGCYSITALPLADRRGVLTVYTSGDFALSDTQIKFLQTLAALLSISLLQATAKAGGAG